MQVIVLDTVNTLKANQDAAPKCFNGHIRSALLLNDAGSVTPLCVWLLLLPKLSHINELPADQQHVHVL